MIDEYIINGRLSYYTNISKKGNISKDLFQIDYKGKRLYLLCTFNGLTVIKRMLIS
jgi:hypothetical protein